MIADPQKNKHNARTIKRDSVKPQSTQKMHVSQANSWVWSIDAKFQGLYLNIFDLALKMRRIAFEKRRKISGTF